MKLSTPVAVLGLVVALGMPSLAAAQKKGGVQRGVDRHTIAVTQLPSAVTASIDAAYPKAAIVEAAKLARGGQVVYEVTIKRDSDANPTMILAMPDGTIRPMKAAAARLKRKTPAPPGSPVTPAAKTATAGEPIAVDQLPKAVTKAIRDAYPKDTIIQAFKTTVGNDTTYELVINDVASVQPLHVVVNADGKIVKK